MLAQTSLSGSMATLVFLLTGLLVALVVTIALLRILRRRLIAPEAPKRPAPPTPDAWEESARRLSVPPDESSA